MTTDSLRKAILDYEVKSSWWAGWIGNPRLQTLAAKYFAWKVDRKFNRYLEFYKMKQTLSAYNVMSASLKNQ